jgi:DNA-binding NarL/FixJ family response regulator
VSSARAADKAMNITKVLIVDDHPIVRQGIRLLVDQEPDMAVCGEADCATEAMKAIENTGPDVAIVDLSLKDSSGLDLIKDIRIRYPDLVVLVLSMRDEFFYAERVLRAGARGYITKEEGTEKVIDGIRKVLAGEICLAEKLAAKMISRMVEGPRVAAGPSVQNLSDRELEVFELLGRGLTTREIAEKLHLSIKTIESHREHIKDKLKLANANELLKQAIQWVQ